MWPEPLSGTITLQLEDNPQADVLCSCALCGTEWEPPQDARVFVAVFVSGVRPGDQDRLAGYLCRECEFSLVAHGGLPERACQEPATPPRSLDPVREYLRREIAAGQFVITPEINRLIEFGMPVGNEIRRMIVYGKESGAPWTRKGQA